jgi:hypothetical protein
MHRGNLLSSKLEENMFTTLLHGTVTAKIVDWSTNLAVGIGTSKMVGQSGLRKALVGRFAA